MKPLKLSIRNLDVRVPRPERESAGRRFAARFEQSLDRRMQSAQPPAKENGRG